MTRIDTFTLLNNCLAILVQDVKLCHFATQTFRHQVNLVATHVKIHRYFLVEHVENVFVAITQGTKYHSRKQFTTTVNTYIDQVFSIEFKV